MRAFSENPVVAPPYPRRVHGPCRHQCGGFGAVDAIITLVLLVFAVALFFPALASGRTSPQMQNNTQLRGIHQGMFTFAQSNKSGGGDGYFPGFTSHGKAITADNPDALIPAGTFGQNNDIPGYAASEDDVALNEMNDADTGEGFMQYAFAKLLTGDFIPAGSSEYFINPADDMKSPFIAGDAGRFDMSKVSYTMVNVAVDELAAEWKETVNTSAIVLADRAIGNGDTFGQKGSTASSVWTEEGSGDWRGGVTRNDASTSTETSYALPEGGFKYGGLVFEDEGSIDNLFAHPDGETMHHNADDELLRDQGVLFDQDENGKPGGV